VARSLWKIDNLSYCSELYLIVKNTTPANVLRGIFETHCSQHSNDLCIYTDGSKNPDGTSFAFIYEEYSYARKVQSDASIFTVELMAIYRALKRVSGRLGADNRPITVFTDSRSAIISINKYPQKNSLSLHIQQLIAGLRQNVTLCWVPSHVGVVQNERVDTLARTASRNQVVRNCALPRSDYKTKIKRVVSQKWQSDWLEITDNKYRLISPDIKPLSYSCSTHRSWEIALCRLRIGHTTLTHGHLMDRSERPYCEDCLVPLSVLHILTECPTYLDLRQRYFGRGPYNLSYMLTEGRAVLGGPMHKFIVKANLYRTL